MWETTGAQSQLLASAPGQSFSAGSGGSGAQITVDSNDAFQQMAGFGGTMTASSAYVLMQLSAVQRSRVLRSLFSPAAGIGLDYVRVPVGSSDFSRSPYTEDDKPGPASDPLRNFALASADTDDLIPVLKQILLINPDVKFLASPWSAPAWMKCRPVSMSKGLVDGMPVCVPLVDAGIDGGTLKRSDIVAYANYLIDFLSAYRHHGIAFSALTIQNEPEHSTPDYPSMALTPGQEERIAAQLHSDGLGTQILGLDHNWDDWTYAQQLLTSSAKSDFAGIAFHCYGGNSPAAVTGFRVAFPMTPTYETECTPTGSYAGNGDFSTSQTSFAAGLLNNTLSEDIQSVRAGSRTVMLFNIALNATYGPTLNTSCLKSGDQCLPLVALDHNGGAFDDVGYYVLGQLSKFVQPGATRIDSSSTTALQTIAFKNPNDGSTVLLVLNTDKMEAPYPLSLPFSIDWEGQHISDTISRNSVETFVWPSTSSASPTATLNPTPTPATTPTPTPTVTVATPSSQATTVGTAVSLQINASDSAGNTLTYSAANLPDGLAISPVTGLITGTPTTTGTFSSTVTATDTRNASGSTTFTWTVTPPAWTIENSPSPGAIANGLAGVSCVSASDCIAVGQYNGIGDNYDSTLVEQWNGTAWSVTSSPNPTGATKALLIGVSCVSASDCMAVGGYTNDSGSQTLVEQWNGTAWSIVSSPNPGTDGDTLERVSCVSSSNCTAVGFTGGTGPSATLVEQWNGTAWSVVSSPNPTGSTDSELFGVSCVSVSDCTAVGAYVDGVDDYGQTLVEQWDGSAWSLVSSPNQTSSTDSELYGVSCVSASDCTAVGAYVSPNGDGDTFVEQWDGSAWSVVSSPSPTGSTDSLLTGVSCVSASECTAVGVYIGSGAQANGTGNSDQTLVEQWDGSAWSVVSSPNQTGSTGSALIAVSCVSASVCDAVGSAGNDNVTDYTLTEQSNGSS